MQVIEKMDNKYILFENIWLKYDILIISLKFLSCSKTIDSDNLKKVISAILVVFISISSLSSL